MTPQQVASTPQKLVSDSQDLVKDSGAEVWEPSMPPTDLIFDDGEPLESSRHRVAINTLINSIKHHFAERNDYFVGGNMFVYYSSQQVKNKDFKSPDFFIVLSKRVVKPGKNPNLVLDQISGNGYLCYN